MYLDNNNHFYGKINGKNIFDFTSNLNYQLDTCDERIIFINKKLNMYEIDGVEFYDEYWDEVYDQERKYGKIDIVIGKDKSQYSESNIAKSLELLANYILAVDDNKNEINYKIYTSEELFKRVCQEEKLINQVSKVNGGLDMIKGRFKEGKEEQNSFPIFQLPKNYKKVKDLKMEKSDLKKYPPMKDYYDFYEYLKEESKRLWNKEKLTKEEVAKRNKIKKILPEIKQDILSVKKQMQQPIIWKAPLSDNGCPSWDELDMFDKKQVRELLRVHKGNNLQDDITCIVQDLNNLINKIKFTEQQYLILNMWSDGMKLNDISVYTKTDISTISRVLNTVINMMVKQYEEDYTNWYYLNICKGEYKRCCKCGEIKLINYFDKKGKQGFQSQCKKCRKS